MSNAAASTTPCIKITDSRLSINFGIYQSSYPLVVSEKRGGTTKTAGRNDLPTRGNGNSVPLFVSGPPAGSSAVFAPTFSPTPGTYSSAQTVAISSATSGSAIRYTTNGTNPTSSSGILYNGPITINSSTTLKAIAYKSGLTNSGVLSGTYTINIINQAPSGLDGAGNLTFGTDSSSYGTFQDGQGGKPTAILISTDRKTATLTGNAWKSVPLSYTVTSDTVLSVTVQGSDIGEILGVSLDNNSDPTSGRRAFLLGGSQVDGIAHSSWSWTLSPGYTAGSSAMTFRIPVGTYFTGTVSRLGLIADDDNNASSQVTFSNLKLSEGTASTSIGAGGAVILGNDQFPYGDQDGSGGSTSSGVISASGKSITLTGNAWKLSPLAYVVTANTILEVTIDASDTGEILGISLDNDTSPTNNRRAFILGGNDLGGTRYDHFSWTISPLYTAGQGSVTYAIPVGSYFTGPVTGLGLIADDDANALSSVTFSGIRLYEGSGQSNTIINITPVADSYVRAGSYSNTNYGSATNLRVKGSFKNNYIRTSYLRFDLSSVNSNATTINLVLPVTYTEGSATLPIALHALGDDGWSESGLNWNNRPNTGSLIQEFDLLNTYVGSDIVIDVTSYVKAQKSADGLAGFALVQSASINAIVDFGSRESTTPTVLEVEQ